MTAQKKIVTKPRSWYESIFVIGASLLLGSVSTNSTMPSPGFLIKAAVAGYPNQKPYTYRQYRMLSASVSWVSSIHVICVLVRTPDVSR